MTKKVNISSGLTWTYGYDNKNEVTLVERRTTDEGTLEMEAEYKYDAFGNRLEKLVDDDGESPSLPVVTRFAYDGWNPAKPRPIGSENFDVWGDFQGDFFDPEENVLASRYLRGDVVDQLFARVDVAGEVETPYWLLTDRLGSIREVADGSGTVVNTTDYDGFGNIVNAEADPGARGRYGWMGRERDLETGLQYNRARYYDGHTGRWLSQDPLGFGGHDSNLYRAMFNNPLYWFDPSGLGTYREGPPQRPNIVWDNGFQFDPNATPTWSDTYNWAYYGTLLSGAQALGHIPDATRAYAHYRDATGTDLSVDYNKAYGEDSSIRSGVDGEIASAQNEAERLHRALGRDTFNMTGSAVQVNSATENWQKALGGHNIWGAGSVTFNAATRTYTMTLTITMEDFYNFNQGQADIATGLPDNDNGRFEVFGWARSFYSRGNIQRTVTWTQGCAEEGTVDGGSSRVRDRRDRTNDRGRDRDRDRRNR